MASELVAGCHIYGLSSSFSPHFSHFLNNIHPSNYPPFILHTQTRRWVIFFPCGTTVPNRLSSVSFIPRLKSAEPFPSPIRRGGAGCGRNRKRTEIKEQKKVEEKLKQRGEKRLLSKCCMDG